MTVSAAKEKLHEYINHADEEKIFELLSLFENNSGRKAIEYDEATLTILRERSHEYLTDRSSTITFEEFKEKINRDMR